MSEWIICPCCKCDGPFEKTVVGNDILSGCMYEYECQKFGCMFGDFSPPRNNRSKDVHKGERRPGEIDYESGTVFWPFKYNAELFVPHLPNQHGKSWIEQSVSYNSEKWKRDLAKIVYDELKKTTHEKEDTTMQVSYNGFTGELVKMDRHTVVCCATHYVYDISIYDSEKHVTHSFTGVKLEDVKFMGGAVAFGG